MDERARASKLIRVARLVVAEVSLRFERLPSQNPALYAAKLLLEEIDEGRASYAENNEHFRTELGEHLLGVAAHFLPQLAKLGSNDPRDRDLTSIARGLFDPGDELLAAELVERSKTPR